MRVEDRTRNQQYQPPRPPMPAQFEQCSVRMEPDAPLDQFSTEGWELVSVVPDPRDPGMVIAYFRRRRG